MSNRPTQLGLVAACPSFPEPSNALIGTFKTPSFYAVVVTAYVALLGSVKGYALEQSITF